MAALEKFSKSSMVNMLRHIEREIKYPKNADIDLNRSGLNYSLAPDRGMRSYSYLKKRLSELHYIKRDDIKLLAGWVVTAPKELPDGQQEQFFQETYSFLAERYGEENCIQAIVHRDESGESHMHFYFIPVVRNDNGKVNPRIIEALKLREKHPDYTYAQLAGVMGVNKGTLFKWIKKGDAYLAEKAKTEKVSARELLDKKELQSFHPDLQKYLRSKGITAKVHSGVTKAQGGNMTVEQLKAQRKHLLRHGVDVDKLISQLDRAIEIMDDQGMEI